MESSQINTAFLKRINVISVDTTAKVERSRNVAVTCLVWNSDTRRWSVTVYRISTIVSRSQPCSGDKSCSDNMRQMSLPELWVYSIYVTITQDSNVSSFGSAGIEVEKTLRIHGMSLWFVAYLECSSEWNMYMKYKYYVIIILYLYETIKGEARFIFD